MRIAFAGSPPAAVTVMERLIDGGHSMACVITQPDRPRGRGGKTIPTAVGKAALDRGLDLWRPATINDPAVLDDLRVLDVGALCVVGFGQLLKDDVLSGWTCINVHFSLLPAYRGAAPVERAIMDGLTTTGVTIMQMDAGLDTGPMIATEQVAIAPQDDAGVILNRLAEVGGDLLSGVLSGMETTPLTVTPQPDSGESYAAKIGDEDRWLDRTATPAQEVNRIRALSPHVGVRLEIGGQPFKLWRAAVSDTVPPDADTAVASDAGLLVAVGDGAIAIDELQPPGKGRMAAADFLRGWRGDLTLT